MSSFAFVIWKENKSKIVIDLRKINICLYFDVYFWFKLNTILSFLNEFKNFSFIDLTKKLFQQHIKFRNYWKTTFATFHKKLEWLIVSNMKLENISGFFQNRMKKIFKFYFWKFVLIYMNEIIIYSTNFKQYFAHFDKVLNFLKKSNVILILKKCHFGYFNIKAWNHHVFRLKLSIFKKKNKNHQSIAIFQNSEKIKNSDRIFRILS